MNTDKSVRTHTPGPWVLDADAFLMEPGFYGVPRDGHDSYHSVRIPGVTDMTGFCGDANARLIAAAPALLEALTYARRFLKDGEHDVAFVDEALALAGVSR